MRPLPSFVAGMAAGAFLMYYLDASSGGRRRALVRDRMVSAGHELGRYAQQDHADGADRAGGLAAGPRRMARFSTRTPESDHWLFDRIRSRLGRLVSHLGAVHVEVEEGHVRLTGHVLAAEIERLLDVVRRMPGVQAVQNALAVHEDARNVPELRGRREPAPH